MMVMREIFTNRAKKALQYAQEEAKMLRHRTVGTEHILLGLVTEEDGIAGKTLREAGLTSEDVRDEIEHLIDYGPDRKENEPDSKDVILPYSPRSRQIMSYAADEARRLNSPLIGTEHLLLGLLRDDKILSSQIIKNLNLSLSKIRQSISKKLGVSLNPNKKSSRGRTTPPTQSTSKSKTPTLDSLARDLTKAAREERLDPIVGV